MAAGLRAKKRLAAMEKAQSVALALFARHGFDAVSMEEVARQADIGVATLYRHFGTKEGLVIWDSFDATLDHLPPAALSGPSPLAAIRDLVLMALGAMPESDARETTLARLRLIMGVPALRAAALENADRFAQRLGGIIETGSAGARAPIACQVLAHTAVATLQVAIEAWLETEGKGDLRALVDEAFGALPL